MKVRFIWSSQSSRDRSLKMLKFLIVPNEPSSNMFEHFPYEKVSYLIFKGSSAIKMPNFQRFVFVRIADIRTIFCFFKAQQVLTRTRKEMFFKNWGVQTYFTLCAQEFIGLGDWKARNFTKAMTRQITINLAFWFDHAITVSIEESIRACN